MPNQITAAGLETKTRDEIVTELTTALQGIYGADINVASDSPDGQLINIFAQNVVDVLELITQVHNGFNPDTAVGRVLDDRCALNGVIRLGGTYTRTNVTIVTDRALNLAGLDAEIDNPDGTGYTVSDSNGNEFILEASQVIAGAGTYSYAFRAKNNGKVETVPNTITTPVTIVLGVVSVNNPSVAIYTGIDEETDAALRIRRQKSVSISSKGYLEGLLAALLNINGVTSAFVYENNTGTTDIDGIPSHSIWAIVSGGADADIAQAIYQKRNAGCGMRGAESVVITQVDGSLFEINFDRTATEDLYIEVSGHSVSGAPIDTAYMETQLLSRLVPGVYETITIYDIIFLLQDIEPNYFTDSCFISLNGSVWDNSLKPTAKNKQFVLTPSKTNIAVF